MLFGSDWDTYGTIGNFGDWAPMIKEARALRAEQNFAPDTAIHDLALALRQYVDEYAFAQVLASLPVGAIEFWQPD